MPVIAGASQVVPLGRVPVNFALQGKYWLEGPTTAPDWGIRFVVVLLLPT